MQKDVMNKINLLVEMSGTPNNYDTLEEELHLLEKKIEKQKEKVRNLKKSVAENSYIKSSDRIIDENIKISIENKLEYYKEQLEKTANQIAKYLQEETTLHDEITTLEQEKNELNKFLQSLELKVKTIGSKDKAVYDFYVKLIEETSENVEKVSIELKETRTSYESFCELLDNLGNNREELETKIKNEKERLEEINRFLANPNSYIDQTSKQNDEKLLDNLMDELEEMEHRKREILKDPAYLAHEAITLLVSENFHGALLKTKEIVDNVVNVPYMDTDNNDLEEILENAINKRDTLATEIENKNYEGQAMEIVTKRIDYLAKKKKEIEQKILLLRDTIKKMDVEDIKELLEDVTLAKNTRENLKKDMKEYQKVMDMNKEFKTPKKEASLRAAYKKKEEEYNAVDKMVLAFEKNLEDLVLTSSKLEEQDLVSLEEEVKEIEKEIRELKKAEIMRAQAKDILAVEKDKEMLKQLNDDVEHIYRRQKYNQKPSEILDEIELTLGSMSPNNKEKDDTKEDYVNLNDYRISLEAEATNEKEDVKEEPENEEEIKDSEKTTTEQANIEEEIPKPVILEETEQLLFPEEPTKEALAPVEEKKENSAEPSKEERLKVISIELLEPQANSQEEEKTEPMILEEPEKLDKAEELARENPLPENIADDEYISFNSLLEEGEDKK